MLFILETLLFTLDTQQFILDIGLLCITYFRYTTVKIRQSIIYIRHIQYIH